MPDPARPDNDGDANQRLAELFVVAITLGLRPGELSKLNWRFGKMTWKAGIGHWHAHEGWHTAVSVLSSNGVPIQDIGDTVGHQDPSMGRGWSRVLTAIQSPGWG